eukprot:TRINITY_DN66873_c0_g1_i2.p1 TRINITY_DN66873_c0_g1~~TRINITY_DN66873_c0_g1_i2.p1  ORF type:complete len:198 (-),score=48.82 TRINITY_DN66873_c0_g1_i2:228-821(-)
MGDSQSSCGLQDGAMGRCQQKSSMACQRACAEAGGEACMAPPKETAGMLNQRLLSGAMHGNYKACYQALKAGADLETRRPVVMTVLADDDDQRTFDAEQGMTPLMRAVNGRHSDCVQLLLDVKADVASKDEDGMQPVHFSAMRGMLLLAKADPLARDGSGHDVLSMLPKDLERKEKREWLALLGLEKVASADGQINL